jgi:hypothetical protein
MPTLGAFQSILQLAAGLNLGISGILTLWDNPIDQESKRIGRIRKRANGLAARYPITAPAAAAEISLLSSECDKEIQQLDLSEGTTEVFTIEKIVALIAAVAALVSLVYASEYPDQPITPTVRLLAYLELLVTPVLIIILLVRILKMAGKLRRVRAGLDRRYVSLVNKLATQ